MSVIGEQEEEAQKRLIAAEDALRREASSHAHGTSTELSVRPATLATRSHTVHDRPIYVLRMASSSYRSNTSTSLLKVLQ